MKTCRSSSTNVHLFFFYFQDLRLLPQQGTYGSLPRNARIAVPPDVSSQAQFQRELKPPQYYAPLSRISVPPNSSPFPQRKALPLSVILRLQNPYFGAMTSHPSTLLEEERDFPPYQPPVPILQDFFHQPDFQPQQQPAVYSDGKTLEEKYVASVETLL